VRTIDTAGNVFAGAGFAYTLDTTAPTATATVSAISTDSGSSSTDFVTNDTTLTDNGTNTALGSGEKVQISTDGTTWADVSQSDGTHWTYTDPATHSSSFTYQVRVVDTAGNAGSASSQPVTIDTTAPTAAATVSAITTDSGSSSTDFVTNDT